MNTGLYLLSYTSIATALALAAWSWPVGLRLPAFTRFMFGLGATPLVLAITTLGLTLVWPMAPRPVILGWPVFLVILILVLRPTAGRLILAALARRLQRWRRLVPEIALAAIVLLVAIGINLAENARQPVLAHDALIYLNEARTFANTPRWDTYLGMVNPTAPDSLVSGHTHTWLYSTFLAQALLATDSVEIGADHDQIARAVGQFNLLLMLLAVAGLVWAATGRKAVLTIVASTAAPCIPYVSYITSSSSIDAFRILPILLLGTMLLGAPRRILVWVLMAALTAASIAAHTLNACFAPLLILSRLAAGFSMAQWRGFTRVFLPCTLVAILPVAAFYGYLWHETGRILGNGLHYPFYAGSPLEAVARRGILSEARPTLSEALTTFTRDYGWWVTTSPLVGVASCIFARAASPLLFLALHFVGAWSILLMGTVPGCPVIFTRIFVGNFRYSLAVWMFGIPLAAAGLNLLVRRFQLAESMADPTRRTLRIIALAATSWLGWDQINSTWPSPYPTEDLLMVGERRIAAEVARTVQPGETWITDRNTTAYYSAKSSIFLYTPAGQKWIQFCEAADVWRLLCKQRVRLVALSNLAPDWWPSTALHAALNQPGHSEIVNLPAWQIYFVNLPSMERAPSQP